MRGLWIGPWFIRDEWLYTIHGWWPPERRRRKVRVLLHVAESKAWARGFEAGRLTAFAEMKEMVETTFGRR